jgi:HD-GYP domain-containing protein (c-di-GMP phosphodiesterase class II)
MTATVTATDSRTPKGTEWADIIEVLHQTTNMLTARKNYSEGHPAIHAADEGCGAGFVKLLERVPEIVVALVEEEFLICERPLPELRERLKILAEAMNRHKIECIIFQRGMTVPECKLLGRTLGSAKDPSGRLREEAEAGLQHVLLRYAQILDAGGASGGGATAHFFVTTVQEMLASTVEALKTDAPVDKIGILAVANLIVTSCSSRSLMLQQRSWSRTSEDEAAHATNVAMMTAMMTLERGMQQRACMEATAAALLHDIGELMLPDEVRCIPEPLLEERLKPVVRNHTFAGATLLLGAGCSPLWVAAALEHHRGVDGMGYPALDSKASPNEIIRMISLANYMDRKRTLVQGKGDDAEGALAGALALEERYFGKQTVRRFIRALGIYPAGTTVELSDGTCAVVIKNNPTDPRRPQVKILRGAEAGKYIELRDMNSKESRYERSIVRPIPPPLLLPVDAPVRDEADKRNAEPEAQLDFEAVAKKAQQQAQQPRDALAGIDKDLLDIGALLHDLVTAPGGSARKSGPSFPSFPSAPAPPPPSAAPLPPPSSGAPAPPVPSVLSLPPLAQSLPPLASASWPPGPTSQPAMAVTKAPIGSTSTQPSMPAVIKPTALPDLDLPPLPTGMSLAAARDSSRAPSSSSQPAAKAATSSQPAARMPSQPTSQPVSRPPMSRPDPRSEPDSPAPSRSGPVSRPAPASRPDPRSDPSPASRPDPRSDPSPMSRPDPRSEPSPMSRPDPRSERSPMSRPDPRSEASPSPTPSRSPPASAAVSASASAPPPSSSPLNMRDIPVADPRAEPSDPFVGFVLGFVDGATTVRDIIDAAGLSEADGTKIIRQMLAGGQIRMKR